MVKPLKIFLVPILISPLLGCAHTQVRSVLPENGATMNQIYQQKMQENGDQSQDIDHVRQKANAGRLSALDANQYGYTRSANNEINNLFPKLPNPTVVMYVYPHLTEDEAPVPGYSTVFSLYQEEHYALPGEAIQKNKN